jgi:hypothetical protein
MDPILTLNVGGRIFQTHQSTLMKYPEAMLARCLTNGLAKPNEKGEYFFDRNQTMFEAILEIYRTSQVHCPPSVAPDAFNEELRFWGFDELPLPARQVSDVCRLDKLIKLCLERIGSSNGPDPNIRETILPIYARIIEAVEQGKNQVVMINQPAHDFDFGPALELEYFTFTKIELVTFRIQEMHDAMKSWGPTYFARIGDDIYYLSPARGEIPLVSGQIHDDGTSTKPERRGSAYICTL